MFTMICIALILTWKANAWQLRDAPTTEATLRSARGPDHPENRRGGLSADDPGAFANGGGGRRVANDVVDIVLQLGAAHLELFDFLVGGEIDFLLDAVNLVIKPVVFVKHIPEMVVRPFEAADGLAVFRKLSQDGMMQVHGMVLQC